MLPIAGVALPIALIHPAALAPGRLAAEGAAASSGSSALLWIVGIPVLLLVIVAVIGMVLQSRLKRRVQRIADEIDGAARGEPISAAARGDDFAPILEAASRLARSLQDTSVHASTGARRFEVLARSLDVGLLQFRADGGLEFANDRALSLLDAARREDLAEALADHRSSLESAFRTLRPEAESPVPFDLELNRGVRRRAIRLQLRMIGDSTGVLAVASDRESENLLETDKRLADHLRGLSRVNASIAHDIRGPLNAIVLNLELFGGTLGSETDAALRERHERYIAILRQEVRRLRDMVETVVGQIRLTGDTIESFDMRGVIKDLEALLDSYCRRHHVTLKLVLPDSEVPLEGNRDALKQALFKIIMHSLDAMPGGGELELALSSNDRDATVTVTDTGSANASARPDAAARAALTPAGSANGTGIGVARSVVDAHRGHIRVRSDAGSGTRFEIDLPLSISRT